MGILGNIAQAGLRKRVYKIPSDFSDVFSAKIWRKGDTVYTDFDFDSRKNAVTGLTAYVDPVAGSDTTSSGTQAQPFRTMAYAVSRTAYSIYKLKPGVWRAAASAFQLRRNMRLEVWGTGVPELTARVNTDLTYTVNGTYSSVYQATMATTIEAVIDRSNIDEKGAYIPLTQRTSLALVNANPGSWYYASNILYIRTFDSRPIDSNIAEHLATTILTVSEFLTADTNVHIEGIHFYGRVPAKIVLSSSFTWLISFTNCRFAYSTAGNNGFYVADTAKASVVLKDCSAYYCNKDGLNYDGAFIFEWGTTSWRNGSGIADNGSTSHLLTKTIRVGCNYQYMTGKAVQDINNSKSLLIRCAAGNSLGADPYNYPYASNSSASGYTNMWLYECIALEPGTSRTFQNFNLSTMNIFDGEHGNLASGVADIQSGSVTNYLNETDVYSSF